MKALLKFGILLLKLSILFTFVNMEDNEDIIGIPKRPTLAVHSATASDLIESSTASGLTDSSTAHFSSSNAIGLTNSSTTRFNFSMESQKQAEPESNGPWKILAIVSLISINVALLVFIAGAGAYVYKTTKSKATYGFPK